MEGKRLNGKEENKGGRSGDEANEACVDGTLLANSSLGSSLFWFACAFLPTSTSFDRVYEYSDLTSSSVALILAFVIPRVPSFAFNSDTPLVQATGEFNKTVPFIFSRAPANFSFPAFADLQIDTGDNFIPLTFKNIHAKIFDLETSRQVAEGDLGHTTVPAKSFPKIQIPMNFTYVATNDTDQTCK